MSTETKVDQPAAPANTASEKSPYPSEVLSTIAQDLEFIAENDVLPADRRELLRQRAGEARAAAARAIALCMRHADECHADLVAAKHGGGPAAPDHRPPSKMDDVERCIHDAESALVGVRQQIDELWYCVEDMARPSARRAFTKKDSRSAGTQAAFEALQGIRCVERELDNAAQTLVARRTGRTP